LPRDRTQTPPLALPISRLRSAYGIKTKVQATPHNAEQGRSNGALPPATLAAEEDSGSFTILTQVLTPRKGVKRP